MTRQLIPSELSLLLAFGAAIASFIASTSYAEYSEAAIQDAARTISTDLAPSIQHLSAARAETRQLGFQIDDYISAAGPPVHAEEIGHSRRQIDGYIAAYLALARSPEEQERRRTLRRMTGLLDDVLRHVTAQAQGGLARDPPSMLKRDAHLAVDQVAAMLLEIIDRNALQTRALAMKIEQIRRRAMRIAFGLDALSALLSVAAALMALRAVRRYRALLETHRHLAEDRAGELEEFAGRVAHDLRSPLSGIGLSLNLIGKRCMGNARDLSDLERGQAIVRRMGRVIEGLLAFARAGARPEPGVRADVAEVLADLAAELHEEAAAADVDLRLEASPRCEVACGPGILACLVSNLALNAIKYIGKGPERRVSIRALELDASARIEVEDTGPGLDPALEGLVFEPYVRGKGLQQPGIGLGLATVRRITEAHGGAVGVRPAPGTGCVFWFELPRPAQAP